MNQLTRRTHSKCGPAYGWNILWIGFLMPKSLILVPILFENKMLGLHAQAPIDDLLLSVSAYTPAITGF